MLRALAREHSRGNTSQLMLLALVARTMLVVVMETVLQDGKDVLGMSVVKQTCV